MLQWKTVVVLVKWLAVNPCFQDVFINLYVNNYSSHNR
jgi:hypothetical protein